MTSDTAARTASDDLIPLEKWKNAGRGIAVVTAYDTLFARLADQAGADAVLVGDSVGPTILGIPEADVTLSDMVHHGAAVRRGLHRSALLLDVPPRVAAQSPKRVAASLLRAVDRTGAAAVKIEGAGKHELAVISAVLDAGLLVVGHLARRDGSDEALRASANALARLGLPAIVLVGIPDDVAASITSSEAAATISVSSGHRCDGSLVNSLAVAGLLRPPHKPAGDADVAGSATATTAALADFCARARRRSRGADEPALAAPAVPV
ncbi:MAG TPA: 3-methyl-2-oxobutanoate hydroxymethyltransferase [Gemmatimonadaceae bacterium]|jgi:3-methyl-2-oxobutanoate hydroxymethyltransferase|nr:3-methyl-2-oxobutanoate hydroxymethyltransferase [Gemmatimonadaceae bacterium]